MLAPWSRSFSTRFAARSCSSESSPNWIELVGQALAQAGSKPALQAIVAQRALVRLAVDLAELDHAERAGRHAIGAPVADVLLHHHGAEFGAEQCAGRAGLQASRVSQCLQTSLIIFQWLWKGGIPSPVAARPRLFDEGDVAPRVGGQLAGVVVARAGQPAGCRPAADSIPCTPLRRPCSRCTGSCR